LRRDRQKAYRDDADCQARRGHLVDFHQESSSKLAQLSYCARKQAGAISRDRFAYERGNVPVFTFFAAS
jgi:hypothetical protein